jgi:hypothetical protein
MKILKWLFPFGAILTVGGVFLYALVERLSFGDTRGWGYSVLSQSFLPALLIGAPSAIVGSFVERKRLSVKQTRVRGIICWGVSALSFLLLLTVGNVHGWTFTFIFPAFAGFVAGIILLSKFSANNPSL